MPEISIAETGGSDITSYNLQTDQGTGSYDNQIFTSLVGEIPDNNLDMTELTLSGLSANTAYAFRYRVKNKHGWSDYSDVSTFVTATMPGQVSAPTFQVMAVSPTDMTLSWDEPATGGNPITAYNIVFVETDGVTFTEEMIYCDGSTNLVLLTRVCTIPFTTLRE
jgi:hypothetical protein